MSQTAVVPGLPRLPDVRNLTRLHLEHDVLAAHWIVASLTGFGKSVNSIVPRGFDSYVRVFPPARMDGPPVSWSEIAAANAKDSHGGMQLHVLTGLDDRDVQRLDLEAYEVDAATGIDSQ